MKNYVRRLLFAAMALVVFACSFPKEAYAANAPVVKTYVYTKEQLKERNLSIGVIKWKDDLVKGQITTTLRPDGQYDVKSEEVFKIKAKPKTASGKAKKLAMEEFQAIREYAQTQGWWDCKFKIKSCSSKKVTAKATIEYKAVKVNEYSRKLEVKMTAKKKNGVWTYTYTVDGKDLTANALRAILNNGK